MLISFYVDQAECLKNGINADSKRVELNVMPEDLTPEEREALSHDLRNDNGCLVSRSITLPKPSLDGVREALVAALKLTRAAKKESEDRKAAAQTHAAESLTDLSRFNKSDYPCPENYYCTHYDDYRKAYNAVPGVAEARQQAREENRKRKEEEKRLAREAEEQRQAKLAEAREMLKDELERGKEYEQRLRTLSKFVATLPQDALRGAVKSLAEQRRVDAIAEIADEIESASTVSLFEEETEEDD